MPPSPLADLDAVYAGARVLVTGHTGFKGSWLALWLLELGADVYGYALPPARAEDNFVRCGLEGRLHHETGDVRDAAHLTRVMQDVQPQFVFHLAAQPLVLTSYDAPADTIETNVMGTVRVLDAVRATPSVRVVVNVTSDKCYDNREQLWGYRETDPMGGHDPYSASKGAAELVAEAYRRSFFSAADACRIVSVRAGNVIGSGDWAPHRIVPDYFRAVQAGVPLRLRRPDAVRPWQHVLEPLGGYLLVAARAARAGRGFDGAWNFGPDASAAVPVQTLVERLRVAAGVGSFEADPPPDAPHEAGILRLDITKALHGLGWRPRLTLDETVRLTAEGYRADLGGDADLFDARVSQLRTYLAA